MPNLASIHPIVVHFAIGLLIAGALLRWISLTGRFAWTNAAATTLLLAGTLAAVVSVKSGDDAHGPVERVPGAVNAVIEHEQWGERARNVFLAVALAEIAALVLARKGKARPATLASAALCAIGAFCLYEAAEHGGELVYSYAGGVGIRTGDPADVGRLLVAAAHHQAQLDRKNGRPEDAAAVIGEVARRFPNDPAIQMMAAESVLLDRKDPDGALAVLGRVAVPPDDARLRTRHGLLAVDAHEAAGRPDAARAALQALAAAFPQNTRIRQRLERAGSPAPAPR
jgi:uncharacterized membrane protein